jgi:hypothetical protein
MNKSKIPAVVAVILVVIILLTIVNNMNNKNGGLVSPFLGKAASKTVLPSQTPSYNPPKEIKYDSSTDLKKELESVNPQVLDEDFQF